MKILDIGCGNNKYKGNEEDIVIGMDRAKLINVDVIHDMEKFPYPFEADTFDKVVMQHTLEHVTKENRTNIRIIEEIYRLLHIGGILEVEVPIGQWFHYDPTHKNYVGHWYWSYFSIGFPLNFYSIARFKLVNAKIVGVHGINGIDTFTFLFDWLYQRNPGGLERIVNFLNIDIAVRYILKKEYEK